MLEENRVSVKYGRMSYFKIPGEKHNILFIHDNTSAKEWVTQLEVELPKYSWIIPDLIGFGTSSRTTELAAYSIQQYAEDILTLLKEEDIKKIVIIAHGLGAVIALHLTPILQEANIDVEEQFYIIGTFSKDDLDSLGKDEYEKYLERHNYDIERYTRINTTLSKLIAQHLRKLDPYSIWATHRQLDIYLDQNIFEKVNKIKKPVHYLIGEMLRGQKASEKLMKTTHHHVSIIPNCKANPHIENPPKLWEYINQILG